MQLKDGPLAAEYPSALKRNLTAGETRGQRAPSRPTRSRGIDAARTPTARTGDGSNAGCPRHVSLVYAGPLIRRRRHARRRRPGSRDGFVALKGIPVTCARSAAKNAGVPSETLSKSFRRSGEASPVGTPCRGSMSSDSAAWHGRSPSRPWRFPTTIRRRLPPRPHRARGELPRGWGVFRLTRSRGRARCVRDDRRRSCGVHVRPSRPTRDQGALLPHHLLLQLAGSACLCACTRGRTSAPDVRGLDGETMPAARL